tara:strand:- start:1311 stop:1586 length:276 start_codon:yes stop_codon:yes gene_type:complete
MPRPRSYVDFTKREVEIVKGLNKLFNQNPGSVNHNLKNVIHCVQEDIIVTNENKLSEQQIHHFITLLCMYLFRMKVGGVEYDTIRSVIKFR